MEQDHLSRRRVMQLLSATMLGGAFFNKLSAIPSGPTNHIDQNPKAVFIPPGGGEKGKFGDTKITFKLDKHQTSGNLGSAELILQPGDLGAPPHLHRTFDEICIVLSGTIHVMVGEEVYTVPTGRWHLRPRGIVHTFWNSGNVPARSIELYCPGGHEEYMKDLVKLFEGNRRPKPEELSKLADKHDIVFAFDKLKPIMEKYHVHL